MQGLAGGDAAPLPAPPQLPSAGTRPQQETARDGSAAGALLQEGRASCLPGGSSRAISLQGRFPHVQF